MSYDEDDNTYFEEDFDSSKFGDAEYKQEDEIRSSRTYEGCVSFRYNGMDYDVAVDVTYSWDDEDGQDTDIDVDFLDEPEELYDVWDEIKERLIEVIKNAK